MTPSQFISTCTADAIDQAAAQLRAGSLVAFPTETVYGLGADATNASAVARIYEVKGRPQDHPLIVHIASMDDMDKWCEEIPAYAIALARDFWPGPMTLILKRSRLAQDFITGGQESVGVRVPDHVLALALLNAFSKSVALELQLLVLIDLVKSHQLPHKQSKKRSAITYSPTIKLWMGEHHTLVLNQQLLIAHMHCHKSCDQVQ